MRGLLCLAALIAIGAGPGPIEGQDSLASDSEERWVAFDLTPGNQIRFTTTLNGRAATAILDTGVNRTAITRRFATSAGLRVTASGTASAIGGAVSIGRARLDSLEIGGLTRTGGTLLVVGLPAQATGSARPIDLLVGQDLLRDCALDIDFDRRRFRLLRSGRLPFRGNSAPLSIAPKLGLFITETAIGSARQRPMVVDTGDGASITYADESWQVASPALAGARPAPTSAIGFGLAGPLVTDMLIVPRLTIGGLAARDVEVRIEAPRGYSARLGVAGRIGNGLLARYRLLLDPRAGHAVFATTAATDQPPPRSTSGLQTVTEAGRLRVVHVMRGSPADEGGWRVDETICSVDGQAITTRYDRQPIADWPVDAPGREVRLRLCGGEVRRLTLRHFY